MKVDLTYNEAKGLLDWIDTLMPEGRQHPHDAYWALYKIKRAVSFRAAEHQELFDRLAGEQEK